jgi:hypothetical protein
MAIKVLRELRGIAMIAVAAHVYLAIVASQPEIFPAGGQRRNVVPLGIRQAVQRVSFHCMEPQGYGVIFLLVCNWMTIVLNLRVLFCKKLRVFSNVKQTTAHRIAGRRIFFLHR